MLVLYGVPGGWHPEFSCLVLVRVALQVGQRSAAEVVEYMEAKFELPSQLSWKAFAVLSRPLYGLLRRITSRSVDLARG